MNPLAKFEDTVLTPDALFRCLIRLVFSMVTTIFTVWSFIFLSKNFYGGIYYGSLFV